jgi:hypothetical protein
MPRSDSHSAINENERAAGTGVRPTNWGYGEGGQNGGITFETRAEIRNLMTKEDERAVRKVCVEFCAVFAEWEILQATSSKVVLSLVNLSQRRKDFADMNGNLGVLSSFSGAENFLQVDCF